MNNRNPIGLALTVGGAFIVLVVGVLSLTKGGTAQSPEGSKADRRGFATMAVAPDRVADCNQPKAPADLGIVPIQNAYAQIARIIALETAKATGSCDCPYGLVNWDEVVVAAPGFERTDGAEIRFDNVKLRLRADALQATLKTACES